MPFYPGEIGHGEYLREQRANVVQMCEGAFGVGVTFAAENFVADLRPQIVSTAARKRGHGLRATRINRNSSTRSYRFRTPICATSHSQKARRTSHTGGSKIDIIKLERASRLITLLASATPLRWHWDAK
jgi:hypothetical protein